MAATEVTSALSGIVPKFSGSQIVNYFGLFLIIVVFGMAMAMGTYFLIQRLKFNKTIRLFQKVNNSIINTVTDKGMFARVGTAGDYWCVTKKTKKHLPRPSKQMRKNEYWFYEREDGEWINFTIADIDAQMKLANAHYSHEDMRLARLGIQKNLRDRFQKVSFWEKYGNQVMSIMFLVIVTICLVILFQKMEGGWNQAGAMAQSVKEMAEQVKNMQRSSAVPTGILLTGTGFSLLWRRLKNGI